MAARDVILEWQRHVAAKFSFASHSARHMKVGLAEAAALEQIQTSGPLTPGEIGRRLAMPSGSVTALIDRLDHKRLIVRQPNPADRRGYHVALSPQAHERAKAQLIPMAEAITAIAEDLGPEGQAAVIAFLKRVRLALLAAYGGTDEIELGGAGAEEQRSEARRIEERQAD